MVELRKKRFCTRVVFTDIQSPTPLILFRIRWGMGDGEGGAKRLPPTSFSPVTSADVGINP